MKKLFMILALAALLPWSAVAQDARQRTTATIVADALDQLPADKQKTYDNVVKDLASTGAEGIVQLAGMLVPADQGKNATLEYALYAVVSYVTGPDKDAERAEVRRGLMQAIDKCTDKANKAFLMNMFQRCAIAEDAPFFVKYAKDEYLADWAINGLALIEGTDEAILDLMKNDGACREKLAYAAGDHKLQAAEPILIGWVKDADAKTKKAIYHALGIIGTAKSLPVLGAAAKAANYDWEPEIDANSAYLRLIKNLAAKNDKAGIAAAKATIEGIIFEPEVGAIYEGVVTRAIPIGAFVEFAPKKEGMVHISKLDKKRTEKVEDVCNVGDKIKVKFLGTDDVPALEIDHIDYALGTKFPAIAVLSVLRAVISHIILSYSKI